MGNPVEIKIDRNRLGPEMRLEQGGRVIFTAGIHGRELNCYWPSKESLALFEKTVGEHCDGEIAWNKGREALCGIMDGRGFSIEPLFDRTSKVNGWLDLSENRDIAEVIGTIADIALQTMDVTDPVFKRPLSQSIQEFVKICSVKPIC